MLTGRKQGFAPTAILLSLFVWVGLTIAAIANEAKIAVAANFTGAAKQIAKSFERETGHKAVLIFGSTGKLYAQILHGAPFDVFLAADQKRPRLTRARGLAVSGTLFTYAIGKITLYSTDPALIDGKGEVLNSERFNKLAMANPATAPYGAAARQVLTKLGIYDRLKSKIVMGENAAQTHQFVMTGNAQLGFVASSQLINVKTGSRWPVPDNLYAPIRQDAVLLKHGANNDAAKAFLHYLKGQNARAILKKFGYDAP